MTQEIKNRKLCFCGKLAGMSRKDAETLARGAGAVVAGVPRGDVDLIVIGEANPIGKTWIKLNDSFDEVLRQAFEAGRLEMITETTFWQWLGLHPDGEETHPLYTPSALAELAGVKAAAIRHWFRFKLLHSASKVGNLPYFTFEEILAAKRLKTLTESGYSPRQILRAIESLQKSFPQTERVLLYLWPTSDPKKILYADGKNRRDSGGQKFFDFDLSVPPEEEFEPGGAMPLLDEALTKPPVEDISVSLPGENLFNREVSREREDLAEQKIVDLCQKAWQQEEAGDTEGAIHSCRTALLLGGPDNDISIQLAELLTETGNLEAAKERYYLVLENDGHHLEAMTGLAQVLDRLGRLEEAAELYQTALKIDPGFSEVHYRLGELLVRLERFTEAEEHLLLFKSADPDSLLGESADLLLGRIQTARQMP